MTRKSGANKRGGGLEGAAADGRQAQVDNVAQAFLTLKAAQFERGELDLAGPYTAEDVAALAAESFEEAERLLEKQELLPPLRNDRF